MGLATSLISGARLIVVADCSTTSFIGSRLMMTETENVDDLQLLESEEVEGPHGPNEPGCAPCPSLTHSSITRV